MSGLTVTVIRQPSDEASTSAEFRYLDRHRALQIGRAFAEVRVATPAEAAAGVDTDAVLLLGSANVLVGAASLSAMADRLRDGADVVVPAPLAAVGPMGGAPVYTLNGYEQLERRFLAAGPALPPASTLPLSLWRAAAAAPLLERGDVLATPPSLDGLRNVARAGLFHEFIDYYGEVREDVLPFIPDGVEDVLEVGCGRGVTGALVQERRGCRVTGLELNPVVARDAATRLHRVICGDAEEVEVDGRFDAVIALELFEHLVEPIPFLQRMAALLRPGGRVVLSTPNVGHYSVVADLAAGRWDYLPIGLLCYTHVRFFTRHTLEEWLAMADCGAWTIEPQQTELPDDVAAALAPLGANAASLRTKGFWVVVERPA